MTALFVTYNPCLCLCDVQRLHLGQVPEGSVRQLADAVPLQLEHLQAGQTLEGKTFHLTYTVPVQFPAEDRVRPGR